MWRHNTPRITHSTLGHLRYNHRSWPAEFFCTHLSLAADNFCSPLRSTRKSASFRCVTLSGSNLLTTRFPSQERHTICIQVKRCEILFSEKFQFIISERYFCRGTETLLEWWMYVHKIPYFLSRIKLLFFIYASTSSSFPRLHQI